MKLKSKVKQNETHKNKENNKSKENIQRKESKIKINKVKESKSNKKVKTVKNMFFFEKKKARHVGELGSFEHRLTTVA